MALDMLQGSSPAVVVFPSSWNATFLALRNDPIRNLFRQLVSSYSATSTILVACSCFDVFNENSQFFQTGQLPDEFLPMIVTALTIQYAGAFVETVVGQLKGASPLLFSPLHHSSPHDLPDLAGVNVSSAIVPSGNILFSYGPRSLYMNMPRNRNDLFDIAASGVLSTLTLSLATLSYGLKMTFEASQSALAAFPTIPAALLKVNTLLSQLFLNLFPDLTSAILDPTALPSAGVGVGMGGGRLLADSMGGTLIHFHWMVIVGALSFLGNVLQLIPIDNSAGSKLTAATLGKDTQTLLSASIRLFNFVLFVLFFFGVGAFSPTAPMISKARLTLDYFFVSLLISSDKVSRCMVWQ